MEAIAQVLASLFSDLSSDSLNQVYCSDLNMDDDDVSTIGSQEQSWLEGKCKSLQTYLDSIPYECESLEEMQAKLEFIISRLYIAAKAKNWELVTAWDGLLQWYLQHQLYV